MFPACPRARVPLTRSSLENSGRLSRAAFLRSSALRQSHSSRGDGPTLLARGAVGCCWGVTPETSAHHGAPLRPHAILASRRGSDRFHIVQLSPVGQLNGTAAGAQTVRS